MRTADWINPKKALPAMFSKKTAFGLNPLNIGGEADKNRGEFSAPGSTGLRDERRKTADRNQRLGINQPAKPEQKSVKYQKELDDTARRNRVRTGMANKINYSLSV